MDIDLGGKTSGVDLAKKIREVDWESHIIFLTNHDKMFEQVYRSIYEVFDFIEKFHNFDQRLISDIKLILSRQYDNKMFTYHTNNLDFQIYYKEILYIERDTSERKLIIHTEKSEFLIKMNLMEMMKELDQRFNQVHKSCIVNTENVIKYDWFNGEFTLKNGKIVKLLSKKYKGEIANVKN